MTIVGIDIDDVCADLIPAWLQIYKLRSAHVLKREDITDWNISLFVKPEFREEIYSYIEMPLLYNMVKPVAGALDGYNYLKSAGYDIVFVTHATPGCAGRKFEWLIDNGFDVDHRNYIECQRKELIDVDILVDDKWENVRDTTGVGILFNTPWNQKYEWSLRASNWKQVVAIIEGKAGLA